MPAQPCIHQRHHSNLPHNLGTGDFTKSAAVLDISIEKMQPLATQGTLLM
jgi:hypothetical protein